MNSNPYRISSITDFIDRIKDIAAGCDDRYTQQKLDDLTAAEGKAKAYDEGFKAGSAQKPLTNFGYTPYQSIKVVVLSQQVMDAAMYYFPKQQKINAIKEVRTLTGMGLKDAKDAVDSLWQQEMDKQHNEAQHIDYNLSVKY